MSRGKILLTILLTAAIAITLYLYWSTSSMNETLTKYGDITVQQAHDLIQSHPKLVILDVRTQQEYDEGHIERAILIPLNELGVRLGELSMSDDLLVYCRTGTRSSQAVGILKANGYTRIFHMKDGITTWIQAGYTVTK